VTFLVAETKKLPTQLRHCVERAGLTLKSLAKNLKSAQNMRLICVNFSSIHQRVKTEAWITLTFGFWALAATVHLLHNYGKDHDKFFEWVIEILVAAVFAASFGWHLQKYVSLHQMEKRGKLYTFTEEF
jgi:hypothetical protein